MRRTLLLAATLGTFAMLATPAAAGDYRPHHASASSSFLGIFVWPAPKTIHHPHPRPVYLYPQPVYRYAHPLPRPRWHHWYRPQPRHFDPPHHGKSQWRPGHQEWRHGGSPWRHDGRADWRGGGHDRRHGDGWRQRSGRDHGGHDRGRR